MLIAAVECPKSRCKVGKSIPLEYSIEAVQNLIL